MAEPRSGNAGETTALRTFHEDLGAVYGQEGGVDVVDHYGRPDRAHRAVRRGVGVTHAPADVILLKGEDRVEYLDNLVTASVPAEDGRGCYALLLDPQGRIEADLYAFTAADRLLVFTPPGQADGIVAGWETFIQDVEIEVATDAFVAFGVHGPTATEKVASVLTGAAAPAERLTFVRGSIADVGVTVIRADAPAGEVGYVVVCAADAARPVADALLLGGMAAVPFGRATWRALTLEAGTPLFETELAGRIPNVTGARTAVDFEKGCFVGQEVVSKVENRGRPSRKLVGLVLEGEAQPAAGSTIRDDGAEVGTVTRAAHSPDRGSPIAFALVDFGLAADATLTVVDGETSVEAGLEPFPLVDGSERSGRIPRYQ